MRCSQSATQPGFRLQPGQGQAGWGEGLQELLVGPPYRSSNLLQNSGTTPSFVLPYSDKQSMLGLELNFAGSGGGAAPPQGTWKPWIGVLPFSHPPQGGGRHTELDSHGPHPLPAG